MDPTGQNDVTVSTDSEHGLSPGHACLVSKALNRLVSMGKGKPKTLPKLYKSLETCTSIITHLNPLDVLEIANDQSEEPPPLVEITQATSVYTRDDGLNETFWELAGRDRNLTGQYFTFPPLPVKTVLLKRALKWLQSKPEGTEESLLDELYQQCKMQHDRDPKEITDNLQRMGFVNVDDGGAVSYNLPQHSDLLLLKDVLDTQDVVFNICTYTQMRSAVHEQGGYVCQVVFFNNMYYTWNPYVATDDVADSFLVGGMRLSISIDLTDVQALFLLDGVEAKSRPREMSDLLKFIKPACTFLHLLLPAQVFGGLRNKLQHRPVRKSRKQDPIAENQVIGNTIEFSIGIKRERKTIPLTPEGLLGLNELSQGENNRDVSADAEPEAFGVSKQFASILIKNLATSMQTKSAVVFEATDDQKSVTLAKVSNWIDSYTHSDTVTEAGNEDESSTVKNYSKPRLVALQHELISLCSTGKVTRLPTSALVTMLQNYGYISVDENELQTISYHIPDVLRGDAPYWQVAANKYWRSSVEKCYSRFILKYFPRVRGRGIGPHRRAPQRKAQQVCRNYCSNILIGSFMGAFVVLIIALLISWIVNI